MKSLSFFILSGVALLYSSLILGADLRASAVSAEINDHQPNIIKNQYLHIQETFPHTIAQQFANRTLYLSREYHFDFNSYTKDYLIKESINRNQINDEYMNFKQLNNLDTTSAGLVSTFIKNKFYIDNKIANHTSTNIFEEGFRFVVSEDFTLFVHDKVTHTGLLGGKYGLCAGILKFDENGKICFISNATGHYLSNEKQLQDIVQYLAESNMLAEDAIVGIWDNLGNPFSWRSFLKKQIPEPTVELTIEMRNKQAPLQGIVYDTNEIEDSKKSLARRVLDILHHHQKEEHLQHSCHPHEDAEEALETLIKDRPHGQLYDNVVDIASHYRSEKGLSINMPMFHLPKEAQELAEQQRQKDIIKMASTRPHTELWKQLFGDNA